MKSYDLDSNATIIEEENIVNDTATLSPAADKTDDVVTDITAPEDKPAGNSILDAASAVAGEQAKRTTVGKKVKEEPKRIKTDDEVLARAKEYAASLDPEVRTGKMSRVAFVRHLALWEDKVLQRGDVLTITSDQALGISPATASTQFQFARSARFTEHQERSTDRDSDAEIRAARKLAAAQEKVKARAEREVKYRLEREAKEAARAKAADEREQMRRANLDAKEAQRVKAANEREQMRKDAREAKEAARLKAARERDEMRDSLREAMLKANREAREQAEREAQAKIAAAAGQKELTEEQ
jgi:hypothetical protein